ncbi:MAG: hypothetical protein M1562_02565 [Candidatus Marsarchaeota archaeon]|nr:hypothetical protein [Candidatus Marsarchaeota archaeon]
MRVHYRLKGEESQRDYNMMGISAGIMPASLGWILDGCIGGVGYTSYVLYN